MLTDGVLYQIKDNYTLKITNKVTYDQIIELLKQGKSFNKVITSYNNPKIFDVQERLSKIYNGNLTLKEVSNNELIFDGLNPSNKVTYKVKYDKKEVWETTNGPYHYLCLLP